MFEAALGGERQFFAAEFDHPTRGPTAVADRLCAVGRADRRGATGSSSGHRTSPSSASPSGRCGRARRGSAGSPIRAPVMMWVTRLDRVRDFVNDPYVEFVGGPRSRGMRGRSTGARGSIPTTSSASSRRASPAKPRCSRSRSRARYRRATANIAGCAACRSRASTPTASWPGSSASATDITLAKEAESSFGGRSRSGPRSWRCREAQFRAVFEAALEVMVLLEPDGTVIAVNNGGRRGATEAARSHRHKLWDAPTLQTYPQHVALMKKRHRQGGGRRGVHRPRCGWSSRAADRPPRRVGPAGARARRRHHLSAVRSARHHRAQGGPGAAAPEPEDGGARPADRRHRARLQQSADRRRRRPRHHRQARRRPEAEALCRQCACRPPSAGRG